MSNTIMNGNCVERAVWRFGCVLGASAYVLMNGLLVGLVFMSWRLGIAVAVGTFIVAMFKSLRKLYFLIIAVSFLFVSKDFLRAVSQEFAKHQTWFDALTAFGSLAFGAVIVFQTYGVLFYLPRIQDDGDLDAPKPENSYNQNNSKVEEQRPTEPSQDSPTFDPFEILSVERTASPIQIRKAYLEQIQLYHPDRVDHLGPELQKLAHEQTLNIRRAYDQLITA